MMNPRQAVCKTAQFHSIIPLEVQYVHKKRKKETDIKLVLTSIMTTYRIVLAC